MLINPYYFNYTLKDFFAVNFFKNTYSMKKKIKVISFKTGGLNI